MLPQARAHHQKVVQTIRPQLLHKQLSQQIPVLLRSPLLYRIPIIGKCRFDYQDQCHLVPSYGRIRHHSIIPHRDISSPPVITIIITVDFSWQGEKSIRTEYSKHPEACPEGPSHQGNTVRSRLHSGEPAPEGCESLSRRSFWQLL